MEPVAQICCNDEMVWVEEEHAYICVWCSAFFDPDLGKIDNSDLNKLLTQAAEELADELEDHGDGTFLGSTTYVAGCNCAGCSRKRGDYNNDVPRRFGGGGGPSAS